MKTPHPEPAPSPTADAWLEVLASRDFTSWLAEQHLSLACTTYQTAKLFLLGRRNDGALSVFERTFNRCMGLWSDGQTMWMSSEFQLWRFENVLLSGVWHEGYDQLYIPRIGYTTGDLDAHDLVVEPGGRVVFANTKFSCLATTTPQSSFAPLWRPAFISKLAPEDRCHLNGVALRDGRVQYVTVVAQSDATDGWRDRRRDGGCVIDVQTGNVVVSGLSMPHSPRFYRGQLWVLNSGAGQLGRVDLQRGTFEPVAFCPGYLRGLAFSGDYALVTLSKPRHEATFRGLPLSDELLRRGTDAQCGIQVVDLRTGDVVHWLRMEGQVTELYDVVTLPGATRPMALGFKTNEIQRLLSVGEPGIL
ncbi:MAG: TIGR03032 family protein [Planctomycetes bacterium]|nr:TIGR03032 family protein [Planctomycetota bacterium]